MTTKAITEETSLKEVLSSPKNVDLLKKNGVETVGQAKQKSIQDLIRMGIGEVTVDEIRGLGVKEGSRESADSKIEETAANIVINSPHARFCLQIMPGDVVRNPNGRGHRVVKPIYIACESGKGILTRKMWFRRKYMRDEQRVQQAERDNEPWRVEAYEWLKERKGFKRTFRVLSD